MPKINRQLSIRKKAIKMMKELHFNEQKFNEVELEQVSGGMPHEKEIEKYDGQHGFITKDPFGNVTFTDKTGAIGKYSASDWTKLSANWAYTGNPEFYMSTINVDELNGILSGL